MANKLYKIIGGEAYDVMQHPMRRIQDAAVVEFEEGTCKVMGGTAYPITRFNNLPFGIRTAGGNMTMLFSYSDKSLTDNPIWVGLGSSTMANHGLSGTGYGDRIDDRQATVAVGSRQWVNLGLDGQNSAAMLPTSQGGDPARNIDAALSYNPSFVIVDEPTNWALSWDAAQQRLNYLDIFNYAWQHGVITLFNSSRPRTQFNAAQQQRLADFAALCLADPLLRYIVCPTFAPFLKSGSIGEIKTEYDLGDGIHLNAAGTLLLEQLSWAFWGKILRPRTAYLKVEIHQSADDTTYTLFDTINDVSLIKKAYTLQNGYYKNRATLQDGSYTDWSNTVEIADTPTTTELLFNFTQTETVTGYANIVGSPNADVGAVRSATQGGITVDTVTTDPTYWGIFGTNASDINGEDTPNPTFALSPEATRSYLFTYNTTFNGSNYNIRISGFNDGEVVPKIEVLASRDAAGVSAATRLMDFNLLDAVGNELIENFDVKGNTANLATFTNKQANASGEIFLAIHRPVPTTSENEFGYINAMRITRTI